MSHRQVTTMVLKDLKRIADDKGDDEQKGNSEHTSGQKKSKTSAASEQILHLIRGEKSCFMIGSNPDSQYKVPRIVGWEELEREERPVKTSYDSHATKDTQKNQRAGQDNEMGGTFQTKEHEETCVKTRLHKTRQHFSPDELH